MKNLVFILLLLVFSSSLVYGDVFMKTLSHEDEYYSGGSVTPEENETITAWYGDNKCAYLTENRTILVDKTANILTFINHIDSSYAEASLPLDMATLIDEQFYQRLQMFPTQGEVKETKETKKIGKHACKCYEVTSYILFEGTKYYERESKVWVATDLSYDMNMYHELIGPIRTLRNYNEELRGALDKIEGVELESETIMYMHGFGVNSYEKLEKITEKDPPKGIYSVPEGYTKKERLTRSDLSD